MIRRWWERYLHGVGAAGNHLERCPFCGQTFDIRDPCQVLMHYNHQAAAGTTPPIDLPPEEDKPPSLRNAVPFRRRGEG